MIMIAGLFVVGAVLVRWPPGPSRRKVPRAATPPVPTGEEGSDLSRAASAGARRAAAAMAGLGLAVLIGWPLGVPAGAALAVGAAAVLSRLESAAARAERLAITADAPLAAELLAAALAAGVPLERAVPVVADAIGGPLGRRMRRVGHLVRLGRPAASAWGVLGDEAALAPLVAAVARSARTGAPLADLIVLAAGDLRDQARAQARAEIRAASVRAVLPLGLCLLPAFALLGVAPLVGGLVSGLLGGW
jgi:Flp pilus assembly protein TadB